MNMIRKEYRCFYEGQQEQMYFDDVAKKIQKFNPNIRIKFNKVSKLTTLEGSSTNVQKLAAFDYDMNEKDFENKVKICKNTQILYTSLNFDLWLLLHKTKFTKQVNNNSAYVDLVREKYNLPKKSNIKCKTTMEKILKQIEIEDIKRAIKNAKEIMNNKLDKDKINVGINFYYYDNPSMNINEFFEKLFKELKI